MVDKQTEGHWFDGSTLWPVIKHNKPITLGWMWPQLIKVLTNSRHWFCKLHVNCREMDSRVELPHWDWGAQPSGQIIWTHRINLLENRHTHLSIYTHNYTHPSCPLVTKSSFSGTLALSLPDRKLNSGCCYKIVQTHNLSVPKNDGWMAAECPDCTGHIS